MWGVFIIIVSHGVVGVVCDYMVHVPSGPVQQWGFLWQTDNIVTHTTVESKCQCLRDSMLVESRKKHNIGGYLKQHLLVQ